MKTDVNLLRAEKEAEDLLSSLPGQDIPIDPFQIALHHKIIVKPQHLKKPGFAGCLVKVADTFGIIYSTHINNDGFIRFTVAHELGHYFLPGHPQLLFPDGSGEHFSKMGLSKKDLHEREADAFASGLLMPKGPFKAAMNSAGNGFPAIKNLAGQFRTSLLATARRYIGCTDDAVAVIVSKGETVEYAFLSTAIEDWNGIRLPKRDSRVPPNTTTREFNSNSTNISECKTSEGATTLDAWLEGAPEVEINEDVVGLGSYGRTLTVLFSEGGLPDPDDECDDYEEDNLEF